jgi:hypothetical protein
MLSRYRDIFIVSNEADGHYHSAEISAHYPNRVRHVVKSSLPVAGTATISEVHDYPDALLVVTGRDEWPQTVASGFRGEKIAIRFAYLAPGNGRGIEVDSFWAANETHMKELESHFGYVKNPVVESYPWKTDSNSWAPLPNRIVAVTTVTEDSGVLPNQLLKEVAFALQSVGVEVVVSLHPREDPSNWTDFILGGRGLPEAAKSTAVVAVAGSALEEIERLQVPLLTIPMPYAPQHINDHGTAVTSFDEAFQMALDLVRPEVESLTPLQMV